MTIEQTAKTSRLIAPPLFLDRSRRSAARNGRDEYIDARLRESLAQVQALLLENRKLVHQQKVLTALFPSQASGSDRVVRLTARERQVMELVLAGHPSKNIAADLGVSQRTVENHRASIMKKTGSKCIAALARFALAAAWNGADEPRIQHLQLVAAAS